MKKGLFLSDLHVGCLWSLWPAHFKAPDPQTGHMIEYPQNPVQKLIYAHWKAMLPRIKDVDFIVLNGDLCQGNNKKDQSIGLTTPDLGVQAEACKTLLRDLPKVPTYATLGSKYHTEADRPLDQFVAESIGATFGNDLVIEECGIRMHAQHYIPVSKSVWMYRTTGPARDMLLLALQDTEDRYGKVDLALRSHAHYFVTVQFRSSMAIITPCWQARTPYAVRNGLISLPDLGWVVLKIEDRKNMMVDRSGIAHLVKPCRVVGRRV